MKVKNKINKNKTNVSIGFEGSEFLEDISTVIIKTKIKYLFEDKKAKRFLNKILRLANEYNNAPQNKKYEF